MMFVIYTAATGKHAEISQETSEIKEQETINQNKYIFLGLYLVIYDFESYIL